MAGSREALDEALWRHIWLDYSGNLLWSLFLTSTAFHAVLLVASPLQAVHKWYRRKSSDADTAVPYLSTCIGSTLWLRYALLVDDGKLFLLQLYCLMMQIFYLAVLCIYRSEKKRVLRAMTGIVTCLAGTWWYAGNLPGQEAIRMIGRMASAAQILASLVCPYLILKAVTRKAIDFIAFAPVLFTLVMEIHAIIYSVAVGDFYMTVSNVTFFFMDGLLLIMFFVYPRERVILQTVADSYTHSSERPILHKNSSVWSNSCATDLNFLSDN